MKPGDRVKVTAAPAKNFPTIAIANFIRDATGKPVFTGNENPYKVTTQTDLKRLLAGGTIQLGTNLSPGEYMFEVVVTDLLADQKHRVVTQWMDFQIVK